MFKKAPFVSYFRNFIFGVEDSLVSTVGLLSGVAIAGVAKETIFLTGIVLIFVEAFSMAAGSFLSESTAEEYESGSNKVERSSFISGAVMFFSYYFRCKRGRAGIQWIYRRINTKGRELAR